MAPANSMLEARSGGCPGMTPPTSPSSPDSSTPTVAACLCIHFCVRAALFFPERAIVRGLVSDLLQAGSLRRGPPDIDTEQFEKEFLYITPEVCVRAFSSDLTGTTDDEEYAGGYFVEFTDDDFVA